MELNALAIGTRMPGWVSDGVATYTKRLPRHLALTFTEIAPVRRSAGMSPAKIMAAEGEKLLKALTEPTLCIALDERGKARTSAQLATELERWQAEFSRVSFLIGGADGLAPACKERADELWSLSPLTLPHALVRIVLAEQLYRAWTLLQGHPYHRD